MAVIQVKWAMALLVSLFSQKRLFNMCWRFAIHAFDSKCKLGFLAPRGKGSAQWGLHPLVSIWLENQATGYTQRLQTVVCQDRQTSRESSGGRADREDPAWKCCARFQRDDWEATLLVHIQTKSLGNFHPCNLYSWWRSCCVRGIVSQVWLMPRSWFSHNSMFNYV